MIIRYGEKYQIVIGKSSIEIMSVNRRILCNVIKQASFLLPSLLVIVLIIIIPSLLVNACAFFCQADFDFTIDVIKAGKIFSRFIATSVVLILQSPNVRFCLLPLV